MFSFNFQAFEKYVCKYSFYFKNIPVIIEILIFNYKKINLHLVLLCNETVIFNYNIFYLK